VGLRAGLNTEAGGKFLCLHWGSKPGCPVCSDKLLNTVITDVSRLQVVDMELLQSIRHKYGGIQFKPRILGKVLKQEHCKKYG
jgi:hypothetical protein